MFAAVGKIAAAFSVRWERFFNQRAVGPRSMIGRCKGIDGDENVLLGGMLLCPALRQRYRRKQASTRQG